MPRTLPWRVQGSTTTGKQKSAPTALKRRKITPSNPELEEEDEEVLNPPVPKTASLKRADTFAPPNVEFMLASDQFFIMVEDELHDIAHQFTRSLHRAEYQRLQALAASKNASSISEIQRPTNVGLEKRLEGTANSKREKVTKHAARIKEEDGLSSDEEEKERMSQWRGTNLAALMLGPGQRNKDLSTQFKMKATTRAAAGFHRGKNDKSCHTKRKNQTEIGDSDIDDANVSPQLFSTKIKRTKPDVKSNENSRRKGYTQRVDYVSDTEDNDDDLDGPALRANNKPLIPRATTLVPSLIAANLKKDNVATSNLHSQPSGISKAIPSSSASVAASAKHVSRSVDLSVFDDFLSIPAPKSSALHGGGYKGKAMAALAKKRETEKTK